MTALLYLFLAFTMPTKPLPDMFYGGAKWANSERYPERIGYYNVIVLINGVSVQMVSYWNGKYWDKAVQWWRGPI